jgi:phospholipase C
VIISPLTEKGLIDHTVYDHSSISATLSRLFKLDLLTNRDRAASALDHLLSRGTARDDAPVTLPSPAASGIPDCEDPAAGVLAGDAETFLGKLEGPLEPTLAGFMHVAVARQLQVAAAIDRDVDRAIARVGKALQSEFESAATKGEAVRLLRKAEVAYQAWRHPEKP